MDRIVVPGLPVRARVGITDMERSVEQDLEVHVALGLDLQPAGGADDLSRTVDYELVCDRVGAVVASAEFRLIETIAESCAHALLAAFPSVEEVNVEVRKPAALRARGVPYAAVAVTRRRG